MRRRNDTVGQFSISAKDVEASAPSLGAAISKAQTIASRIQRDGLDEGEDVRSIYVRLLGNEAVARVDVRRDVIETFKLAA